MIELTAKIEIAAVVSLAKDVGVAAGLNQVLRQSALLEHQSIDVGNENVGKVSVVLSVIVVKLQAVKDHQILSQRVEKHSVSGDFVEEPSEIIVHPIIA